MTTVVCANPACQRPFAARRNHGKLARFCSPDCYQAGRSDRRVPAVCANPACCRPFTARIVKGKLTRFCSQPCWLAARPNPSGADHPAYQGGTNYWATHGRVRKARGPAKNYPCTDCSGPARDWSLIHGRDGADPADFEPRCRKCHIAYDRMKARQGRRRDAGTHTSYKGVSRVRKGTRRRWYAQITVAGQRRRLGYFDDDEQAARAYDAAALAAWGKYARLNFPDVPMPE